MSSALRNRQPEHRAARQTLGALGHYCMDKRHVDTVRDYGGVINVLRRPVGKGLGSFKLTFEGGDGSQDFKGNLSELKAHIKELHQPIYVGLDKAVRESEGYNDASAKGRLSMRSRVLGQIQSERESMTSVMQFIATYSPAEPELVDPNADEEHQHGPEHEIRTSDMWRSTGEIDARGEAKNYDPDAEGAEALKPAIIVGSRFDPSYGFVFQVDPRFVQDNEDVPVYGEMPQTERLKAQIWEGLLEVKGVSSRSEVLSDGELRLNRDEMQALTRVIHDRLQTQSFTAALDGARHEERVQNAITRIEAEVKDPESDIFKSYIRDQAISQEPHQKMSNLMFASTSMNWLLEGSAFKARHDHYKFTQRNDQPMDEMIEDFAVLFDVMDHYKGREDLTQIHIEALTRDRELAKSISFQKEMAKTLEEAVGQLGKVSKEEKVQMQRSYRAVQNMFEAASVHGQSISRDFMGDEEQDAIDVVERTMKIGDDGMTRVAKDVVFNTYDFFKDLLQTPFESKGKFVASVGIGAYLANQNFSKQIVDAKRAAQVDQNAVEAASVTAPSGIMSEAEVDLGGMIPGFEEEADPLAALDGGADIGALDFSALDKSTQEDMLREIVQMGKQGELTDEQILQIHPDLVHTHDLSVSWFADTMNSMFGDNFINDVLLSYKHFTIDNGVTGTSLTMIDLAKSVTHNLVETLGYTPDEAAEFWMIANEKAIEMGDYIFQGNIAQNVWGHLPLIISMSLMAAASGPRNGATKIFGFLDEIIDSVVAVAKDKPLIPAAIAATAVFQPEAYIIANADDAGGMAFPLLAGLAASVIPMPKRKSVKAFHKELTDNARILTDQLNQDPKKWDMQDARPDIIKTLSEAALLQEKIKAGVEAHNKDISFPKTRIGLNTPYAGFDVPQGLSADFNISKENIEPVLMALNKFDMAMDAAARFLDIEHKTYHNFINGKVENFLKAMQDFQNDDISLKDFRKSINKDLKQVMAAQAYVMNDTSVHEAIYGQAPSQKRLKRLQHIGKVQHEIHDRKDTVRDISEGITDRKAARAKRKEAYSASITELPQADKFGRVRKQAANMADGVDNAVVIAGQRLKQGFIAGPWDYITKGARTLQRGYIEIPNKKLLGAGAVLSSAALAAMDTAGVGGGAASFLSDNSAAAVGTLLPIGMFLLINPIDDLIVAHLGLGGTAYAQGSAFYGANKFAITPTYHYAKEVTENLVEKVMNGESLYEQYGYEEEKLHVADEQFAEMAETLSACQNCALFGTSKCTRNRDGAKPSGEENSIA